MKDKDKTKEQLIAELMEMRKQFNVSEVPEISHENAD